MNNEQLNKWADVLLNFALGGISTQDVVMIKAEDVAWPIVNVLQEKIIKAGGIPDVFIVPKDNERGQIWSTTVARYGTEAQMDRVPPWIISRYQHMTKYIEFFGRAEPSFSDGIKPELAQKIRKCEGPIREIWFSKPWVLSLYPTEAFAAKEGLPFSKYGELIVNSCIASPHIETPETNQLLKAIANTKQLTIETRVKNAEKILNLSMDLSQSRILEDFKTPHNIPCGEIYTSPNANSVRGEIYFDLPIFVGSSTIAGVYLRIENGTIVDFQAEQGMEELKTIITTDIGSRRIGEVAFGLNNFINIPLKHLLFAEKLGGTMHLAIGNAFKKAFVQDPSSEEGIKRLKDLEAQGIFNTSAQHMDLVIDFKKGGAGISVSLDKKPLSLKDGQWSISSI